MINIKIILVNKYAVKNPLNTTSLNNMLLINIMLQYFD